MRPVLPQAESGDEELPGPGGKLLNPLSLSLSLVQERSDRPQTFQEVRSVKQ